LRLEKVPVTAAPLEEVFQAEKPFLWGLCYRMTGSAADADDLVQETFVRALASPPARTTEPWRPWLVRVAMNLCCDLLRRRRRRSYTGPWLPSPIEVEEPAAERPSLAGGGTEGRYELLESVSFAFLLALEALGPLQRAVLLLRDVFDYSVDETARALGISGANVKTTLHRARRAMQGYDRRRSVPTHALQQKTRDVLERFVGALARRDARALEGLLAADVRALNDGGGEFVAARRAVVGRDRVVRLMLGIAEHGGRVSAMELRVLNGLPAAVFELEGVGPRFARRVVLCCELDAEGRIDRLETVLATRKLTAVRFPSEEPQRL
jgi:RNA polymerase sigma-70 factor (ECF subfamily)